MTLLKRWVEALTERCPNKKERRRRRSCPTENTQQMGPIESLEGEEEDGEIKASIQAKMADMRGEDGEKKSFLKALDVETHERCRTE